MTIKWYTTFLNDAALVEPQIVLCHIQDTWLGRSYLSTDIQSVYSAPLADWATGHSLGGVLLICSDAVGVFYSPNRRGHWTLVGGSLTPLQRCSRFILHP